MSTTAAMQLHDCTQDHQSDMQDATSSGNLKKVVGMNVHASRRCVVEITEGWCHNVHQYTGVGMVSVSFEWAKQQTSGPVASTHVRIPRVF